MKVAVLGSTGEVGKEVVKCLNSVIGATCNLGSPSTSIGLGHVESVTLLNRREVPVEVYAKLFENPAEFRSEMFHIKMIDYDNLKASDFDQLDVCICCLGTTRAKEGAAGTQRVDRDYIVGAAKCLLKQGTQHFLVVSAVNANARSWFVYPRTKGEMEEQIKQIAFKRITIAKPPLILCKRQESRPMEAAMRCVVGAVDFGNLLSISARDIAQALVASFCCVTDAATQDAAKDAARTAGSMEASGLDAVANTAKEETQPKANESLQGVEMLDTKQMLARSRQLQQMLPQTTKEASKAKTQPISAEGQPTESQPTESQSTAAKTEQDRFPTDESERLEAAVETAVAGTEMTAFQSTTETPVTNKAVDAPVAAN